MTSRAITDRLKESDLAGTVEAFVAEARIVGSDVNALKELVQCVGEDGRFVVGPAMAACGFRTTDAFRDFRKRIAEAAADAKSDLAIELEARKAPSARRIGWFTGTPPLDRDVAAYSASEAATIDVESPVPPQVTTNRQRLYVAYDPQDIGAKGLLKQLRSRLSTHRNPAWEINHSETPLPGEEVAGRRRDLADGAACRLVLLGDRLLADADSELADLLALDRRPLLVALTTIAGQGRHALEPGEIRCAKEPWSAQRTSGQKLAFVDELIAALRRDLRREPPTSPTPESPDEALESHSRWAAYRKVSGESVHLEPPRVYITGFDESAIRESERGSPPAEPAVDRLLEWARSDDQESPPLAALLGDVGMGKTTTAKLFTRALLDRRATDPGTPLPLHFDLRQIDAARVREDITLDRILTLLIEARRPHDVAPGALTPTGLRERIATGGVVVIFDGLDEVLTGLSPQQEELFTRQVWLAVPRDSGSKLLLTARSQYFRTIRNQVGYFTAAGREGVRAKDYLGLVMVPFTEEQVLSYLAGNLGWDTGACRDFVDLMARIHDLTELSRRPVTLKMIADDVEYIDRAKLSLDRVSAGDLYDRFVDRWLDRDKVKTVLTLPHKRRLMELIAAGLWRAGRNQWHADDLDDWLLETIDEEASIQRHYAERVPDLWKADFRTATFLTRDGNDFGFVHRSIFEFFLAGHMVRALVGTDSDAAVAAWSLPKPSTETLGFVGDLLARLPSDVRATALSSLREMLINYIPGTSELVLAYAVGAITQQAPAPILTGMRLAGAQLHELTAVGSADARVDLSGSVFSGVSLREARFNEVNFTGASFMGSDLSQAEFISCHLAGVDLDCADLTGVIMRNCDLTGVRLDFARGHRAQLINCQGAAAPERMPGTQAWLTAPLPASKSPPLLETFTGHTHGVTVVAWHPDGNRLTTASSDRTARIWDPATGEATRTLTGHTDSLWAVAWRPDGNRLATASSDRTARIWDPA
ncbi:MAG: NACHT domain-containing protein, partial [Nocardioides sp.]